MIEPLTPESARVLDKSPDERPEDEKILQVPETRTVEWEPTTEEEQIVLELIQKLSAHGIHAYITGGYTRFAHGEKPGSVPGCYF